MEAATDPLWEKYSTHFRMQTCQWGNRLRVKFVSLPPTDLFQGKFSETVLVLQEVTIVSQVYFKNFRNSIY